MKYVSVALAIFGLSALAWSGVVLLRDRNASQSAARAPQDQPISGQTLGGPISHGLQLRLVIVNPPDGVGSHSFRVALVNVSDAIVELKYQQSSYDTREMMPYQDVMRNGVGFSSFPDIVRDSPQTGAPPPDETFIERAHRLLPGELVEVNWEIDDERVALPNESPCGYCRLTPLSTGLFLVRAMLDVETADGGLLKVWSNECPFVVGGSVEPPKPHVVQVRQSREDRSMYGLSAGTRDGVEVGDVYCIVISMGCSWEFTVTEVREHWAQARISLSCVRNGKEAKDEPVGVHDAQLRWPMSRASKTAKQRKERTVTRDQYRER